MGSPRIAILDYGMGNLRSVAKAFEHVGADVSIVSEIADFKGYDALVFPGQGGVSNCMKLLNDTGWNEILIDWIQSDKPYFGICLGLQVLFEHSEEGNTDTLGVFKGKVKHFSLPSEFKIPHMGWNNVRYVKETALGPVDDGSDQYYFVHSYYSEPEDKAIIWAETDYGQLFVSAVSSGNCFATQFHPEKSQLKGLQLYENFLKHVASL